MGVYEKLCMSTEENTQFGSWRSIEMRCGLANYYVHVRELIKRILHNVMHSTMVLRGLSEHACYLLHKMDIHI